VTLTFDQLGVPYTDHMGGTFDVSGAVDVGVVDVDLSLPHHTVQMFALDFLYSKAGFDSVVSCVVGSKTMVLQVSTGWWCEL
jgi:hypothetical protein